MHSVEQDCALRMMDHARSLRKYQKVRNNEIAEIEILYLTGMHLLLFNRVKS